MLKRNIERTFTIPIQIDCLEEDGRTTRGEFGATFRMMSQAEIRGDEDARLLDKVLLEVRDLELCGPDGAPLTGKALLQAVKDDPELGSALVNAYLENVIKKPTRRRT